jgi:LysM repeat protein
MLAAVACTSGAETEIPGRPYTTPESTPAPGASEATPVPGTPQPTTIPDTPQPTPVPASLERIQPQVFYSRGQIESEVKDPILALPGDRVWTEDRGRALLRWPDMHLQLYDDTGMHVEDITPTWLRLALDVGAALNGAVPVIEQRIVWTTGDAEITLTATTVMVAYDPDSQLTILRMFDGQAEMRNLTGQQQVEIVKAGEWALVEPDTPPRVSDRLEEMRSLARELDLWDVFHEIELDVRDGFGPDAAHVPPEDVEIVFVEIAEAPEPTAIPWTAAAPEPTAIPCIPQPPAAWQQYEVQGGDTLYSLAGKYDTTVEEIMDVNCLIGETIRVGQWLWLPPCIPQPPADWQQYEVQERDTLSSLAGKYDTTVEEIIDVNCLIGETIRVGQWLWLPPCIPQPPADWQQYEVQERDTLYSLAGNYGTTAEEILDVVAEIMDVNCLIGETIQAGQWLWLPPCIPQPPADWQRYAVQKGDTLSSLAKNRDTTVAKIKSVNCLIGETIRVGQWLWLPTLIPEIITIELEADADAYAAVYVEQGPTINGDGDLLVSYQMPYYQTSFIHFNLSSIPARATIEDATLLVYLLFMRAGPTSTITVAPWVSDWTENQIPGYPPPDTSWPESVASALPPQQEDLPGDCSWNVTPLVQRWVDGTSSNYGLILRVVDTGRFYQFSSRESTEHPPPRLRIRYTEP